MKILKCCLPLLAALLLLAAMPAITPAADPPETEPVFEQRILHDRDKGVLVEGRRIRSDAELTVKVDGLHKIANCQVCDVIRQMRIDKQVLSVYDISLSRSFKSRVTVTFIVGGQFNGQKLTIVHCKDREWETVDAEVKHGQVSIVTDQLSVFAVLDGVYRLHDRWENPYSDVGEQQWFYEAVEYVSVCQLMSGLSVDRFGPDEPLDRATLVQALYLRCGETWHSAQPSFYDVSPLDPCYEAASWAAEQGIVTGYEDGSFRPDAVVTREQMAVFLYRFAEYLGENMRVNNMLAAHNFSDSPHIRHYALTAMDWAVDQGLLLGYGSMLLPQEPATRAQFASLLLRFA